MLFSVASVSLIGAAVATPIDSNPIPVKHVAQGFNMMLNVTKPSHKLASAVHKKFLTALHIDAGTNKVGVAKEGLGVPFFINGTKEEVLENRTTLLADLGEPNSIPFGVEFIKDEGSSAYHTVWLNAGGNPDTKVAVSEDNREVSQIHIATAGVCMETLPSGVEETVLHQYYVENDPNNIPEECVPVTIIPQCHDLRDSAFDHHLFVHSTFCYHHRLDQVGG